MFLPHLKNRIEETAAAVVVSVAIESTAKPATAAEPAPVPIVVTDPPRRDFSEPVPGLFQTPDGLQRIRFNPTQHGADYYGACECCKANRGGEYWSVTTFTSVTNGNGGTYWPQSRYSLFCFGCTANRQNGLNAYLEPAAEPSSEPLPTFGDVVRTPDGRTGTLRGSGSIGSGRVQVENSAGNRTWYNHAELRRVPMTTEPAPEPEQSTEESGSDVPPSVDFSDDHDTIEDFTAKETAAVQFGKELEANRSATIQGWIYRIEPQQDRTGFQIVMTAPDGFSETICSGFYGFAFDTFDRTVGYAVSKARSRFVCHPETFPNGCQIEKRYHNRRAVFVYVVTLPEPVKGSKFDTLETRAKRFGGWYAREYRPEYQRGGFMFTDKRQADRFARDFVPSAKVATMRHNATPEPAQKPETPSGDFSDRQPKEPRTFGDILKQLTEQPSDSSPIAFFGHVFSIHGKPPGQTITTEPGNLTLTIVRPDGSVAKVEGFGYFTECANAIAEVIRRALNLPGFQTPDDERRDGETRVETGKHNSRTYWTVNGFCGTGGPPTCFDRKRDAIDYAVANRRAILGRWCGAPATYPENWPTQETPSGDFSEPEPAPDHIARMTTAARLEELADGMQKTIDEKTRPMTQNWTVKRGREYNHRCHEGRHYQRVQEALRVLGAHWRAGTVPDSMRQLKAKSAILPLLSCRWDSCTDRGTDEFTNHSPLAVELRELIEASRSGETREQLAAAKRVAEIKAAEDALRLRNVPGFFPTPPAMVDRMVEQARFPETPSDDFSVLEPSAGIGSIADGIASEIPPDRIKCVEISSACCSVLELKGYNVGEGDFLQIPTGERFDRILMNPPFENGQDIDHVRHAFSLLKSGGRLVAIMSEGSFTTTKRKAVEFVEWIDGLGAEYETIRGAFDNATAFRSTGVTVRLVTIDKD